MVVGLPRVVFGFSKMPVTNVLCVWGKNMSPGGHWAGKLLEQPSRALWIVKSFSLFLPIEGEGTGAAPNS